MKKTLFKTLLIGLCILLLIASFTFDAFTYQHQGIQTMSSVSCFFMGAIAVLGGGTLEWLIWLANPLSLIAIYCLIMNKPISSTFAFLALFLAISFYSWNSVLVSESGTTGEILSIENGYYIWVISIFILTIGSYLYFKIYKEIKLTDF